LQPPFDCDSTHSEISKQNDKWKSIEWQITKLEKFSIDLPPTVYPPREDTDLLAKCIGPGRGRRLLEIGCGSGALSMLAARRGWVVEACDINPLAVACTRGNMAKNGLSAEVREGGPGPSEDFSNWHGNNRFDLIIWNLPYLRHEQGPTLGPLEDAALIDTDSIGLATRLLFKIENTDILNSQGRIMLVHNESEKMLEWRKMGWATRCIDELEFQDGEKINVTCIWRPFESNHPVLLEKCESTNTELLNLQSPIGSSLVTGNQTAGKGRRGRTWFDEEESFAGSWVVDYSSPGKAQLAAGLAAIQSIEALGGVAMLKWPNDILIKRRKAIGILAESRTKSSQTRTVIGLGANLKCSVESKDYERSSLDRVIPKIDFKIWHKVIHASIASWFERIEVGNLPDPHDESLTRIIECGIPFYRDSQWRVNSLNEQSELVLENHIETVVVQDGEEIKWFSES